MRPISFLLTIAFVAFLFRRDVRERPNITYALWIPLVWVLISGSRMVSEWLSPGGPGGSLEDGSPLDRLVFSALILGGAYVLKTRRVRLLEVVRNNRWLTIYFLYCFIAISWSDFPFVAFKRWIKTIGEPIMVLIIATEPDPAEALNRLMKRSAYVLLPFSITLIKWFPEIGRRYSQWGGAESGGVTGGKNTLGYVCFVLGLFFFCHFLKTRELAKSATRRHEFLLTGGLLYMVWWLLLESNSSTSLMSLIVGMLTVIVLGFPFISRRFIGAYVVTGIVTILMAEVLAGLSSTMIDLLGRDNTLTGRTDLWKDLLEVKINPIIGVGYESFWLGERLAKLWALHWWRPNESHNGYLETYLNLGLVGLFMLFGLIVATYQKSRLELLSNFQRGRMRLGYLAAIVVYNWTEASFRPLHLVFFAFYIIAIDYPTLRAVSRNDSVNLPAEKAGGRPLFPEATAETAGRRWSRHVNGRNERPATAETKRTPPTDRVAGRFMRRPDRRGL